GGFPAPFSICPAAPLDQIVFHQSVAGSHPADTLDAAVAKRVATDDLRRPGMRSTGTIAVAADIQPYAIRPFDGVVFEDPVIAAGQRDHAILRKRISISRVLEGDALYPNKAHPAFRRNEGVLTRGDLDLVISRRSRSKPHMDGGS